MPSSVVQDFDPRSVHVPRFTERTGSWRGQTPLSNLERLNTETFRASNEKRPEVFIDWTLDGSTSAIVGGAGAKEVWVRLRALARLPMQCQRCLSEVLLPLQLDRRFRFVSSESQAAALDDEAEDYDVLVSSQQFDFQELLEDELLMALPMSTTHDICPTLPQPAAPTDAQPTPRSNAFAALASLQRKSA